jgi:hypothetical protein
MSFRRAPKEIDPRRPPKRRERDGAEEREPRSYGQFVEMTPEEIEEFERTTGEVARERERSGRGAREAHDDVEEREEFEDLAGEPTRENGES